MDREDRLPTVSLLHRWGGIADVPIYALALVSFVLYLVPSMRSAVYETPWALFILNVLVVTPVCLWVAVLAMRAYLAGGLARILFAGSGILVFGLANFIPGFLIFGTEGPNDAVAIHNLGMLASAALHFLGSLLNLRDEEPEESRQARMSKTVLGYGGVAVFTVLVWLAAAYDVLPPFVVPGDHVVPVRLGVLVSSVILFAIGALLVLLEYNRRRAPFLRWYGLGLALIALGLLVVVLAVPGSILSWTGRVSQYIGNLYLFAAAALLVREARSAGLDIEQAVTEFFLRSERHYRSLVDASVNAIVSVNPAGKVILWNPAARDVFGYPPEEASGKDLAALIAMPESEGLLRYALAEGQAARVETTLKRKDGGCFPADLSVFSSGTGQTRAATFIIRDITRQKEAEAAIIDREQKLRLVMDTVPALMSYIDREFRYRRVNEEYGRWFGIAAKDMEGRHVRDVLGEDAWRTVRSRLEQALSGETVDYEEQMHYRTGGPRWVHTTLVPDRDDSGRVRGFVAMVTDISERRRTEEALREQTERNRLIVEGAHAAIWDWDVLNKRVFFSPRWKEMRGYGEGEITGEEREWSEGIHPEDAPRVLAAVQAHFEGKAPVFAEEYRIRCKDGTWKWIADRGVALRDASGRVVRMAGSETDIAERKQAEERLRESEERFRTLAEAAFEGIAVTERGVFLDVSDQFCRMTGYDRSELLGMGVAELIHPTDRERVMENILAGLESITEHRVNRKDGSVIPVETHGKTIWQDGLERRLTSIRDITGRKAAEEALRRSGASFRLLADTAGRLLAADDPQGIVDDLCRGVMEHLDCQAFINFMVDERAGRLRLNACAGIPGEEVRKLEWLDYGVAVCGCAARDKVRIVAEDIFHTSDARTELVRSYGIRAYCCHPLMAGGDLVGTLSFGTKTRDRFTPDEIDLMRAVADQVSVAMERIRALQSLRESEGRLQAVVDNLPVGVWFANATGKVLYGNPAGQRIWAGARLVGPDEFHEYRAWWADTGKPLAPEDWAVARAVRTGEASLNEVLVIQCFDGSKRTILNSAVPFFSRGTELAGVVVLNEDITERRHAEEALRLAKEHLEERVRERTAELVALTEDLIASRDQLRALASELTLAEEQERKRIAVVLHDEVAQTLAAAKMRLDLLRLHLGEVPCGGALTEARDLLEQSIRETRALMTDISPPLLFEMGLAAACESLVEKMSARHGIPIRCDISGVLDGISQDLRIVIFQIIRELLTNAVKHSGARNVRVTIEDRNGHLQVMVSDDGIGFDPQSLRGPTDEGGFGLFSIRERILAFNGNMTIVSSPEAGTEVTMNILREFQPLPAGKGTRNSPRGKTARKKTQ